MRAAQRYCLPNTFDTRAQTCGLVTSPACNARHTPTKLKAFIACGLGTCYRFKISLLLSGSLCRFVPGKGNRWQQLPSQSQVRMQIDFYCVTHVPNYPF